MGRLIVCMGVCGCGKTTLANALAARAGWPVLEGDEFHSPANIARMADGIPLTDPDREAWIRAIRKEADRRAEPDILLACSALSPTVQAWLGEDNPRKLIWLWLDIDPAEAARRVAARPSHFMPAGLVKSQFDSLQPPREAIQLPADQPVQELVARALARLQDGAPNHTAAR
ncbi:gluconokinase [Maricaulis maris]|jgi:gluconokinase|uniref:Gluconokinase n=1 Tax=Maricaulis maris (strain MCS10) TaxID=394221 RepID=Q0AL27_MARMM|nr:gluconokinase, GntK/IdnK-type [Maricaulis maris]ABI67016.1 gluconate kinase, SKI family [Maricaulis maris MCS10]